MPATPYTPREWVEKKLRKKLTTEFIEIFLREKNRVSDNCVEEKSPYN